MLKQNLNRWERALRLAVGFVMLAWAVAGGAFWGYFGLWVIATASWGFSPGLALWGRRRDSDRL